VRKSPSRDDWEEIGDAAIENPVRSLYLLFLEIIKELKNGWGGEINKNE